MSKLKHTGTLETGIPNDKGEQQRSFTLGLLTVNKEIEIHESLLINHPKLEEYSPFKRFTIERATRLSVMLDSIGDITDITPEILMELTSYDFELITEAEYELAKKLKEPLEELSQEAQ